ncbi:hypothetical protein MNNICLKF_02250 [Synechococcus sp. CBW1107]|nr:hypothetical protein MNNICLKF_02250 [Synechococcus sp. CBW1107]
MLWAFISSYFSPPNVRLQPALQLRGFSISNRALASDAFYSK